MEQKRSILIVDDEVDASRMTKLILEKSGLYKVSVCNRGSEALTIIRETRPELVLLDIVMPDADGADIAAKIRSDPSLAHIRVVFMTALISPGEESQQSVLGGNVFLARPFDAAELLRKVKGFLAVKK